jgi:hypothetical protein
MRTKILTNQALNSFETVRQWAIRSLFLTFIGMSLGLLSCEKENLDPDEEIPQNCNVVLVEDNITEPTIWTYGNVYVIKRSISVRNVLTIDPGVIVKLKDASIDVVGGKILAVGTAQRRIVFTSIADDRYCGDNNGDAAATKPAKGDWQQIYLNGTTETTFKYVDIFYAGQNRGGSSNAVRTSGSNSVSFTFDNCRIAHTLYQESSYDSSCAFYTAGYMVDPSVSKFTNNVFYDNGKPLYINAYYTLDPSNKFHNPENSSQTNTHNGIYLSHSGLDRTVNWNNTEVPYVLDEYCQVYGSSTINIGPNVIVKFKRSSAGLQRSAPQNISMHETAILTSYRDDAHGGDTNGDSDTSSPTQGDWIGFRNNYSGSPHYQQGSNILYATN